MPPPPGASPLRLRPDNPETSAGARLLFGFPFRDMEGAHGKWLVDRKAALKRQHPGSKYFNYVLDKLGIVARAQAAAPEAQPVVSIPQPEVVTDQIELPIVEGEEVGEEFEEFDLSEDEDLEVDDEDLESEDED